MFKEFKRQVFGSGQERQRKQSKEKGGPLTSKDYFRMSDEDLEALEDLDEAYGKLSADINR